MPETKTPSRAAMECAEAIMQSHIFQPSNYRRAERVAELASIIEEKMGMGEIAVRTEDALIALRAALDMTEPTHGMVDVKSMVRDAEYKLAALLSRLRG